MYAENGRLYDILHSRGYCIEHMSDDYYTHLTPTLSQTTQIRPAEPERYFNPKASIHKPEHVTAILKAD